MRRITLILFGFAMTFINFVGSAALGQEGIRYRALLGNISDGVLVAGDQILYDITPITFQGRVWIPNAKLGKDKMFELFLLADPLNGRATFDLQGQGLTICSAHGPNATVDKTFLLSRFGEPDDVPAGALDNFFGGSSPSDLIIEGPLMGRPFFGCGSVFGETVSVSCTPNFSECSSDLTMHGFVHAHGAFGNYIGPTTIRVSHSAILVNGQNDVSVEVILPDGSVTIQGSLQFADSVYCETDRDSSGEDVSTDCRDFN